MIKQTRHKINRDRAAIITRSREFNAMLNSPTIASRKIWGTKCSVSASNESTRKPDGTTKWEPLPIQHIGGIPEINEIVHNDQGKAWEEIEITVDWFMKTILWQILFNSSIKSMHEGTYNPPPADNSP